MSFLGITASSSSNEPSPPPGDVYATGGVVTDITGFKIHTFNSSATFATTASWPSGRTIQYLVVAGGGGSNNDFGGGGGAGGLLTSSGAVLTASTNYVATVGAGGGWNTNGSNSSLIGGAVSVIAIGGGGSSDSGGSGNGQSGGSGGGGFNTGGGTTAPGGAGTAGQGNSGAAGQGKFTEAQAGGGGGAGYAGGVTSGPNFFNAQGGFGLVSTIFPETSSSTTATTPGNNLYSSYTFTVPAGLWFLADQSISVTSPGNANASMCGIVTSYSGTSLVCKLRVISNTAYAVTASSWIIAYAYAGGGTGKYSTEDSYVAASLGGGGGHYGLSSADWKSGFPNSGGGGMQASSGAGFSGGSGVVLIKYAYP